MNWTGPLWLAAVPFVAQYLSRLKTSSPAPRFAFLIKAWPATIVVVLLLYGATLHYLTLGFPGIPYPKNFLLLGWSDLASQIERIEDGIEGAGGAEPLVVGMDKMQIASGLAFYRNRQTECAEPGKRRGTAHRQPPSFLGRQPHVQLLVPGKSPGGEGNGPRRSLFIRIVMEDYIAPCSGNGWNKRDRDSQERGLCGPLLLHHCQRLQLHQHPHPGTKKNL